MYFLLILALPVAGAVIAYIVGRLPIAALTVGLVACLAEIAVVVLVPYPVEPVIWAGIGLLANPFLQLMAILFAIVTAISAIMAWEYKRAAEFVSPALGALSAALAVLYVENVFVAVFLLATASFLIVFAVLGGASDEEGGAALQISTAIRYIILMTLASLVLTAAFVLAERYSLDPAQAGLLRAAAAALAIGFALRIGVAPFHLWVPSLSQHGFLPVFMMAASVLTPATVVFLLLAMRSMPWLISSGIVEASGVVIALSAAASLAYILSFAQKDVHRAVAYVISGQAGYILVGFALFSVAGVTAGLLVAVEYTILVCLITVSVSSAARLAASTGGRVGLVRAAPFASAGFIVATLGFAGIPPFGGFAGRFLLIQAVSIADASTVIWLIGAAILGLVACARAFSSTFLSYRGRETIVMRESWISVAVICVLVAAAVLIDVKPQPLTDVIQNAVKELSLAITPA